MESNDGGLNFKVRLPDDQLATDAARVKAQLQGIGDTGAASGARLDNAFNQARKSANLFGNDIASLQRNILTLASVSTLGRLGKEIINVRGEFQQLGIAFETMLGSKEKSDRLMAEQIALAQKTPFTLVDVATNTKQLLAMGIGYEKVMQTMKDLGNVAAGVSVPLSRIAINYGQVATLGKLQQREIRDFAMAGIPIIDELAKNLGKAKDEIFGMVEAGQIGFPEVEKAFQTMSGEGGKFYNLMEKQNASVTGQISNLTDKLQVMMNELGKSNEGLIYGGISGVVTLVENYKGIIDVLEVLAITYGTVKAAQIAVAAYESVMAGIDATRTKIIAGKVAALQAEFAVQDAAAAKAKILAAEETSRAAKQLSTEQALTASEARITAAKIANVKATQDLAAAELELQITQARNTAAWEAGFMTLKKSQNVKKEMVAVDKAYSTLKKTEVAVDKAITADTVLNESIKSQAVITGEAEKTAAKVQATAASRALMVANEQATASEIAMAAVNPWMAFAAFITVVVGALIYFRKEVKTTEEQVTDLNKSIDAIGKQIELESAISKYDELKDKVGKTQDEQDELNKSIKTLSAIFPDAIGKTDQYGKAIDLVTEKLKNASAESRKNTKDIAEATKAEAEATKQRLLNEKSLLQGELQNGRYTSNAKSGISSQISLTPEEALANKKRIAELDAQISNIGETISNESAKIYELASVGAEAFIEKNAQLFKEIGKYTRDEALAARDELIKLYGSDGGRSDAAIKKQAQALNDYANSIKTIKEEIAQTQKDLADGEQKLAKMRLPGYESANPKKDIEEQEAVNKELKTKIESLTGIKEKAAKKQLKTEQEKLDALRDLALEELEIYQNLEQSKTDAMIDGERKQRKIIEDSYKSQLLTIEKNKQDFLENLNKSKGLVSTDSGYVKTLPVDIQSQFDQMAINAHQKRDNAILKLDQDLIKNQNAIWDSATESVLSDIDKQIRAINKKYDDLIQQQKELTPLPTGTVDELTGNIVFNPEELKQYQAAMKAFDLINANRSKELEDVSSKSAMKLSGFYKLAFGDIEKYGWIALETIKKQMEAILATAKQISVDGKTMFEITLPDGAKNKLTPEEITQWQEQINKLGKTADQDLAKGFNAAAQGAQALSAAIGDSNQGLADMFIGISNAAGAFSKLIEAGAFSKEGMSTGDAVSSVISGATQLIGMVINQAAENKRVMKEYYANIIAQQREYNLLLNDQIRLNSDIKGSVFLSNYEGKINDSVKALNDAQKGYGDAAKKFNESEAIVGKKNVVSGGNVLSGIGAGAALGAGIGTIVPVIGTAIGAVVGGIVGGLVGLFAKKKKDVVAPLLETYPDLISANGEFNASLAKTLIANKQVTEETAATLQNLIDWTEKADEARKQMTQVISDLAGSLGDNLRNALVTAFEEGTNAAKVFGDEVSKVLENIVANMLFNKAFEGLFKQLETDMNASYGIGPDGKPISGAMVDNSWTDDITRFFKNAPEAMKIFNQGLADAKKAAGLEGLDIFSGTSTRTGSSKGIAQASQDSVDELNGRFTAIQGHTFSMSQGVSILVSNSNKILIHVAGIKTDTARLENIENSLASVKSGIDTINLKGITLK